MSDSEKKNFDAFDINMHLIIGSLIRKNHAPKRKIGDNDDQIQRLTFFDPQPPFQCERDYDASETVRIANVAKKSFRQLQWYGLVCACDFFFLGRSFNWAQGFHENTINSLEICECMWKTTAIHKHTHKCAHRIYGGKSTPTEMIRWKSGISWFNSHPLYRHFAKHRPPYSSTPLLCRRLNGFPQYYNIKLMY